ncbi:membrane fusion protein, multidrug efflux system [Formivibrio citricus]|uniref:Membrane fusion protein, multidrug efflux system n=1 Tax=Formivibrio citricus TaxID=83765 RepID=A0A1I4XE15_9NEIS|nr:HlyD family secretion protein [Formivibrio citricus]SFN23766.1 membrane fusion protein, multidrug efflux system [Formivibrio citricus]
MTEKKSQPLRQKKARQVFAALAIGIVLLLVWRWWWSTGHVSTDNAQLEGHIVPVSARVGGYVKSVAVADNQPVDASQLLVELDPRDFAARAALAEADYQQALSSAGKEGQPGMALAQIGAAQANAAAAASQTRTMEAQIVEARANVEKAQRDYLRAKELADKKMVSPAALDAADTAVKTARAHVAALEAQLKSSRESAAAAGQQVGISTAGLKSAQAKVMATEAALQLARNQLQDTRVLAPAAGLVSKKAVEPGQMIQAGQTLLYLVPTDNLWVTANLKETELKHVKPGQEVEIEVDAFPSLKLKGKVDSFSGATGARFTLLPPDNATGNFTKVVQRVPVKIALDALPKDVQLRPGLSVNVTILTR